MLDFDTHHLRTLGALDFAGRVRLSSLSLKNMMTWALFVDKSLPRTHAIQEERRGFSKLHRSPNKSKNRRRKKCFEEP
jgi:hypothetical protein